MMKVATLVFMISVPPSNAHGLRSGKLAIATTNPTNRSRVRSISLAFDVSAFLVLSATVLSFLAVFSIMVSEKTRDC